MEVPERAAGVFRTYCTMEMYKKTKGILASVALAAGFLFMFFQAQPGYCGTNLEEKAKYEKLLEQKVEEVMQNLLGPGKARVMIRADIDFSSKESMSSDPSRPAQNPAQFKWQNINRGESAASPQQELLPGFPVESRLNMAGDTNVFKETLFPQSMIKRLTVSLIVSDTLPEEDTRKLRQVVDNLLEMDPNRGDEIKVVRAKFAPVWYNTEMLNTLLKYGIVAVVAILGMSIVTIGFLRMAGAMNNMAGGGQAQKISMDMEGGGGGAPGSDPALGLPGGDPRALLQQDEGRVAERPPENIVFEVPPEKMGILVNMLAKESAVDIALIAIHLQADLRNKLITSFPPEKGSEIIASIAKVRFIDHETLSKVKEELERRIQGAVGGYDKALEVICGVDMKAKKPLFESLAKNYPEIAARVRPSIIFIEDILKLSDKELSILIGTVSVEQLGLTMWRIPEKGRPRIKAQMIERSWMMIEQTMKYGRPAEEKIDKAVENMIGSVWTLIKAARIKNPNLGKQAEIDFTAPAAPAGK